MFKQLMAFLKPESEVSKTPVKEIKATSYAQKGMFKSGFDAAMLGQKFAKEESFSGDIAYGELPNHGLKLAIKLPQGALKKEALAETKLEETSKGQVRNIFTNLQKVRDREITIDQKAALSAEHQNVNKENPKSTEATLENGSNIENSEKLPAKGKAFQDSKSVIQNRGNNSKPNTESAKSVSEATSVSSKESVQEIAANELTQASSKNGNSSVSPVKTSELQQQELSQKEVSKEASITQSQKLPETGVKAETGKPKNIAVPHTAQVLGNQKLEASTEQQKLTQKVPDNAIKIEKVSQKEVAKEASGSQFQKVVQTEKMVSQKLPETGVIAEAGKPKNPVVPHSAPVLGNQKPEANLSETFAENVSQKQNGKQASSSDKPATLATVAKVFDSDSFEYSDEANEKLLKNQRAKENRTSKTSPSEVTKNDNASTSNQSLSKSNVTERPVVATESSPSQGAVSDVETTELDSMVREVRSGSEADARGAQNPEMLQLRKEMVARVSAYLARPFSATNNQNASQWQQHRFTLEKGKSLQIAVRKSEGKIQLQLSTANADIQKMLQQHVQEIRVYLQEKFDTQVELELKDHGEQQGKQEFAEELKKNEINDAGLASKDSEAVKADSPTNPKRSFGFNSNEWIG